MQIDMNMYMNMYLLMHAYDILRKPLRNKTITQFSIRQYRLFHTCSKMEKNSFPYLSM